MVSDPETVAPLHFVDFDCPGTRYTRALCGTLVTSKEEAPHVDQVTCTRCQAVLTTREAIEVE